MKIKRIVNLFFVIICCIFYSCSSNDDSASYVNQKNRVKYRVTSNDSELPLKITNAEGKVLIVKKSFESEFVTAEYSIDMTASCIDEKVLMTVEVYVNGKLKYKQSGNKSVRAYVQIKDTKH